MLGALFAIAICPVCTPALIVLLGVAGGTGSALWGAALLLSFALGRALPMMLGAGALRWIEQRPALERYRRAFDVAGGIALIAMGLYMINAYFIVVPTLAGLIRQRHRPSNAAEEEACPMTRCPCSRHRLAPWLCPSRHRRSALATSGSLAAAAA